MFRPYMTVVHELIEDQRRFFAEVMGARPIAPDVRLRETDLGLEVTITGTRPRGTVLWVHGGAFVAGSARTAVAPAVHVARAAGARLLSIDYRLAPEHPHPAALDDALAAYWAVLAAVPAHELAVAGESAGGTLTLALLLAARDAGLPLPRAAVVLSPASDLTMAGASHRTKSGVDPVVRADLLRASFEAYRAGADAADPRISPLHADLAGLPPTLIQCGSHEVLLDDSTRLAARLAAADVAVTLEVAPGMPHVFQARGPELPEAGAALRSIGRFLREHLDAAP